MHPARIDAERGVCRASTEKHYTAAASDPRKGVAPSCQLTGTFDYQVWTVATVEHANGRLRFGFGRVDDLVGAKLPRPFEATLTPSRNNDRVHAGGLERHHMQ